MVGILFSNLLCVGLIIVPLLTVRSGGVEGPVDASAPMGVVLLALFLYIPLHELLHAAWHPKRGLTPQTVLVIWPAKLRFGVYYEGCMTRRRWLIMRIAPLIFLSILPAGLLALFHFVRVAFALEIFLQVLMLVNGIGSGGDVVAVAWVLRQVPAEGLICFYGGKAYWRQVPPSGQTVFPSFPCL